MTKHQCHIGRALIQERKQRHLSRREAAEMAFVSEDLLRRWEVGYFFPTTRRGIETFLLYVENGLGMKLHELMREVWIQ